MGAPDALVTESDAVWASSRPAVWALMGLAHGNPPDSPRATWGGSAPVDELLSAATWTHLAVGGSGALNGREHAMWSCVRCVMLQRSALATGLAVAVVDRAPLRCLERARRNVVG